MFGDNFTLFLEILLQQRGNSHKNYTMLYEEDNDQIVLYR